MASGIGALQSAVDRVKKKLPNKNSKISVVHMNKDGTVDYPDNCNDSILLVPAKMSPEEWEHQNTVS